jgi:tetratricopeptide (TPR) repeat protein
LQSYRKALAIRELLAAANPNDTQVQIELADEHIKLVDPIEATGDFRGALDNLRKIPPILEKSVAKSSDAKLLDRQAGSYYFIGRMLNQMNEPASALESYRKATAIHESEKSGDPRVASLIKTHLAGDYAGMAESLMYTNNLSEASKAQEHAVQILEDLSRSEPNSAPLRHYLGNSYDLLATIAEKKGEQVRALDFRQRAHELSKQMRISDPSDVLAKYNFAFSDESLGESLIATGHVPEGVARIREALVVFQAAAREGSKDRYVSSGLADCYFGLGMASMSLAIREGGGPVQKKKSLSDALSWFLKSAEVWSEKRKQGALDGGERETADRVDQGIAKCNTALAKLSNIQIPGKH